MKKERIIRRVWLIRYVSFNHFRNLNNEILSVQKFQKSKNQIEEYVKQLYVDNRLCPSEKIQFLKNRHDEGLAYQIIRSKNGKSITIGHDPVIEAIQVRNLSVVVNNGVESFKFEEL